MGRKAIGVDPSSALSRREREGAASWPTNLRCLKPGGRESPQGSEPTTTFVGQLAASSRARSKCRRGESNTDNPRVSHYRRFQSKRV